MKGARQRDMYLLDFSILIQRLLLSVRAGISPVWMRPSGLAISGLGLIWRSWFSATRGLIRYLGLLTLGCASYVFAAGYTPSITTAYPQLPISSTSPQIAWYGGNCGNSVSQASPYKTCDDGVSPVMPIGFTFRYAGVSYKNWSMSTNGVIFFETGAPGTASTGGSSYTPTNLPSTVFGTNKPALMPFWADLWKSASANGVQDANSSSQPSTASFLQYQVLTVSGVQVLVIQLRKVGYYSASGTLVNMQVQLWSTGQIVYAYGTMGVVTSNPKLRIGLQYSGGCNTLANNQSASLSNQSYLYQWNDAASACPALPSVNHYEIRHDGAATLCAEKIKVIACKSSTKPCPSSGIIDTNIINAAVTLTGTGSLGTANINPPSFNFEPTAPIQEVNLTWASGSNGTAALGLQAAVTPSGALVCTNEAGTADYGRCNITVANKACISPPHHFEIQGTASGNTCTDSMFTIKAWADAAQTTPYNTGWTGKLTQTGNAASLPNLGAFTVPAGSSSVNIYPITFPSAGITTFSTTAVPELVGNTTCNFAGSTSCDFPVVRCVPPAPASFNAVDANADAVSGRISSKTAGTAFNVDIYALNLARTAQDTLATGEVLVDLLANTSTGVELDENGCPITGTSLAEGSVSLDAGKATAPIGAVADTWRNVRVRMRFPATGSATVTGCSSDNFAVKPASLAVAASDADWQTAGTARTLNTSSASGTPMHKAGRPFTLRVSGYNAGNVVTGNYNGSPAAQIECLLPATCNLGALSTGTFTASGGTLTSTTANYGEVGAIRATFTDTAWGSVDSADTPASCAGYYVCSSATAIGRFVPDHFDISANSPAFNPTCGSFSYLGQPFDLGIAPDWRVTARNAGGGLTSNYTGSFFKLSAASVTGQVWNAASGTVSPVGSLPAVSVSDLGSGQASLVFGVGAAAGGAGLKFTRGSPSAPFDASLNLSASVSDSEGVTHAGNPYLHSGIGFVGGQSGMRFGRLRLGNATGSERVSLPLPLSAQFWNGQGFVTNTADNCTLLSTPGLAFFTQSADNRLASGETAASLNSMLIAGNGNLSLSAPGIGNFGFLDLSISAPAWLKYNWDGVDQGSDADPFDDNPRARAAFGRRGGANPVILKREIF